MEISEIEQKLKTTISAKRYNHSRSTMTEAVKLANMYGCDTQKAMLAGLLHDCAKGHNAKALLGLCGKYNIELDDISKRDPYLMHGPVGANIAREQYEINDDEIFDAIYYHTFGKADMSLLTKIIFIADYTEPGRDFRGVQKIRQLTYKDLDKGIIYAIGITISIILGDETLIHPSTVEARNYLLMKN